MYKVYAVLSGENKYHASFVLKNPNKNSEISMREHYRKILNKKSVRVFEYYSTDLESLAKDVATNFHGVANSQVILVDGSNPRAVEVANIVSDCLGLISKSKTKSIDLTN